MPVYTKIDGVSRELSSWPVMVDGVQRELSSMAATIDGVQREIFSAVTRWERYEIETISTFAQKRTGPRNGIFSITNNAIFYRNCVFDSTTGKYKLSGNTYHVYVETGEASANQTVANAMVANCNGYWFTGKTASQESSNPSAKTCYQFQQSVYTITATDYDLSIPGYKYTSVAQTENVKGSLVDIVESADPDAYPENGEHTDGFWYVKII